MSVIFDTSMIFKFTLSPFEAASISACTNVIKCPFVCATNRISVEPDDLPSARFELEESVPSVPDDFPSPALELEDSASPDSEDLPSPAPELESSTSPGSSCSPDTVLPLSLSLQADMASKNEIANRLVTFFMLFLLGFGHGHTGAQHEVVFQNGVADIFPEPLDGRLVFGQGDELLGLPVFENFTVATSWQVETPSRSELSSTNFSFHAAPALAGTKEKGLSKFWKVAPW